MKVLFQCNNELIEIDKHSLLFLLGVFNQTLSIYDLYFSHQLHVTLQITIDHVWMSVGSFTKWTAKPTFFIHGETALLQAVKAHNHNPTTFYSTNDHY